MSRGADVREAARVVLPDAAFRVLDMAILSLDIRAPHMLEHAATFAQAMRASDVQAWCDHLKEHQNGGSE